MDSGCAHTFRVGKNYNRVDYLNLGAIGQNLSWFILPLFMLIGSLVWSSKKKQPAFSFKESLTYLRILSPPKQESEEGKKRKRDALGRAILIALIICIVAAVLITFLLSKVGINDLQMVKENLLGFPWYAMAMTVTLTPLAEEMFFRGLLFRKIEERTGSSLLGAVVSSVLFGLAHVSYASVVEVAATMAIGLILCAVTKKTNSLVPAIVTHACLNLISILPLLGI